MPEKTEPRGPVVDLRATVSSLVSSILTARVALDAETAQIAKLYQNHEILRLFQPPAFSMGEVTIRMPFAANGVAPGHPTKLPPEGGEVPHMQVYVDADVLARMPPHAVGVIELKLNQEQLSVLLNQPGA